MIRKILRELEKAGPMQDPEVEEYGYMDHNTMSEKKAADIGARPVWHTFYDRDGRYLGSRPLPAKIISLK